jgi:hypothetical protein
MNLFGDNSFSYSLYHLEYSFKLWLCLDTQYKMVLNIMKPNLTPHSMKVPIAKHIETKKFSKLAEG